MSAAEIIALVSVLSSAAVALTVAVLGHRREDRRTAQVVNAARIDELREVLEEAGLSLLDAADLSDRISMRLQAVGVIGRSDNGFRQLDDKAKGLIEEEVDRLATDLLPRVSRGESRISIRLGAEHPLTVLYRQVRLAENARTSSYLRALILENPQDPADRLVFDNAVRTAKAKRAEFFDAAASVIGPDVPLVIDSPESTRAEGAVAR